MRFAVAILLGIPPLQSQSPVPDTTWIWRHRNRILNVHDLDSALAAHRLWLESDGKRGERADFSFARLQNAPLRRAILRKAALNNAVMDGSDLSGADLREASMASTSLVGSRLDSASLAGATLDEASFARSSFRNVDLTGVVAEGTNFSRAHLEGTDFSRARLLRRIEWRALFDYAPDATGAFYDATTKWPSAMQPPPNLYSPKTRLLSLLDRIWPWLLAVAVAGLFVLVWLSARSEAAKERQQKEAVANAEKSVEATGSIADYVQRELRLLTEQERLNLVRAAARFGWLFTIGTTLTILSVFTPALAVVLYLSTVPQDWHLLAFGVTAGFLFLAAARGISRQEGHQRDTYFRLSFRVARYQRLISVVRMTVRASNNNPEVILQICERIRDLLFEREPLEDAFRPTEGPGVDSPDVPPLAQIATTMVSRRE